MKTILVKVKRRHIDSGACFGDTCPVALALRDAGFKDANVQKAHFSFLDNSSAYSRKYVDSPRSVVRFVRKFDKLQRLPFGTAPSLRHKRTLKPFNFKVIVP